MAKQCIVLHESVTEEMMDSSDREPWLKIVDIIQEDIDRGIPDFITFQTPDGLNFVQHVTDINYGYPFLIVEGESIAETVERIYSLFPTYSREDILRMVRNPMNAQEHCKGIIYLGLLGLARNCEDEIFELFKQILQHEDPGIRICGFFGMGYAAWPEFRDLAQPLAENDPDEGVRQTAVRFLEAFELYPPAIEGKNLNKDSSVNYAAYKYDDIFFELILPLRKLGLSEAETAVVFHSYLRQEPLSEMLQPFADQIQKQLWTLFYSRLDCYKSSITHASIILDLIAHPKDAMTWIMALSGYVSRLGHGGVLPMTMPGIEIIAKKVEEADLERQKVETDPQIASPASESSESKFTPEESELAEEFSLREAELISRWIQLKMDEYNIESFPNDQAKKIFFDENIMKFWND